MMICNNTMSLLVVFLLTIGLMSLSSSSAAASTTNDEQKSLPLRVFVLVGQSNMVGHGTRYEIDEATGKQKNATLQWLVDNVPEMYGMLKTKQQNSGKSSKQRHSDNVSDWTVRKDVLIACNSRGADDMSPRVTKWGYLYAGLCTGKRCFVHISCTS